MRLIVCNIGSSSFKFQLVEMPGETERARGYTERVGAAESLIVYSAGGREVFRGTQPIPTHREAVRHALDFLVRGPSPVLQSLEQIDGVGFKTVQAGELNGTVLLTDPVLDAMERYKDLAPAHNPPYLTAIRMFRTVLPDKPLVGVFEPGFHSTIPEEARVYGAPYAWYEESGVRRYGYHGSSHRYIAGEAVRVLGLPADNHRIISCHLGGSSSLCAIRNGRSIDTSMGFTPQSGLLQGTRVGDMDPFVLPYVMAQRGLTLEHALAECTTRGGLLGLSGVSADMRDINEAAAKGNPRAQLARRKFVYDIKRYIGEYLVLLEGTDVITFTGGIGQKDAALRAEVLRPLAFLGLRLDESRNDTHAQRISADSSPIAVLVLATNEEIVVARETARLIGGR